MHENLSVEATDRASVGNDLRIDVREERKLLELVIDSVTRDYEISLIKLKMRLNTLVPINRLPQELLCLIILLAGSPNSADPDVYLPFTWTCHHWRSVLVWDSRLWTFIKWKSNDVWGFQDEIIRRTKSSKLDVGISFSRNHKPNINKLQQFFDSCSDRIRSLSIDNCASKSESELAIRSLSSLRHLTLSACFKSLQCDTLLSALTMAKNLETLEWSIDDTLVDRVEQLRPVFHRLKGLMIYFRTESTPFFRSTLALLHNSKLQYLSLYAPSIPASDGIIILPELETLQCGSLLTVSHIRAPKLSLLNGATSPNTTVTDYPLLEGFDFSSTKYLYFRGECESCESLFPCISGGPKPSSCKITSPIAADPLTFEGVFEKPPPGPHFHIRPRRLADLFGPTLLQVLSRTINLVELRLNPTQLDTGDCDLRDILTQAPSIERLMVSLGIAIPTFLRLLTDESVLPKLTRLCFYPSLDVEEDEEKYVEEIEITLTACLHSRKKRSIRQLLSIIFYLCPPLSDTRLAEFENLGTKVVTYEGYPSDEIIASDDAFEPEAEPN